MSISTKSPNFTLSIEPIRGIIGKPLSTFSSGALLGPLILIKSGMIWVAVALFGVFGAPLDAESRPGSPGDNGLVRRGHKKTKNSKKHVELILYTFVMFKK